MLYAVRRQKYTVMYGGMLLCAFPPPTSAVRSLYVSVSLTLETNPFAAVNFLTKISSEVEVDLLLVYIFNVLPYSRIL